MTAKKGGLICEVVAGKRLGLYATVPRSAQDPAIISLGKVAVCYYSDWECTIPVKENGVCITGITSITNLKERGFYD